MAYETGSNPTTPTTQQGGPKPSRWQDWVNLVLAAWLFLSPWILQFGAMTTNAADATAPTSGAASWNAWIIGAVVFVLAAIALGQRQPGHLSQWPEWVNLALGAWLFVAPWILSFASIDMQAARWDHWIIGALVFAFAGWELIGIYAARSHAPGQQRMVHHH